MTCQHDWERDASMRRTLCGLCGTIVTDHSQYADLVDSYLEIGLNALELHANNEGPDP